MALDDASRTYSVTELGREVGRALDAAFPSEVWVRGEIRNLSRSPVGHVYFDLADPDRPDAVLPVGLLRANRDAVNRYLVRSGAGRMVDGTDVRIGGFVAYYAARGVVQLRMTRIDAEYTLGRLAAARDELLRRLAAEGLLHRNRSVPMPVMPLRVGLVTSAGSAAAADFLGELEASGYGFSVALADVRVQGPAAAAGIVAALRAVMDRGVDVIALVRGGGSRTDLAAFDGEPVARAIAAAGVPVLTGVGHEVDDTVADRVAHASFKTPTACAVALVGMVADAAARTEEAWAGIRRRAGERLAAHHELLAARGRRVASATRGGLRSADAVLSATWGRLGAQASATWRRHDAALAGQAGRLRRAALLAADGAHGRLAAADDRMRALDPARVLARGWTITRDAEGRVVRAAAALASGDAIRTTFADGTADSVVERTAVRP